MSLVQGLVERAGRGEAGTPACADWLIGQLWRDPTLFAQGWDEHPGGARVLTVVHAVCMLEPTAGSFLLERLAQVPGFNPEAMTPFGVTPLVIVAYNRHDNRVELAKTMLRLGANPNSPADRVHSHAVRGHAVVVPTKPVLGHLFTMVKPLLGLREWLPSRLTRDTDMIRLLIEHGGHLGAAYRSRPLVSVQEQVCKTDKMLKCARVGQGHCLPVDNCRHTGGAGHDFIKLNPQNKNSASSKWLEQLLELHNVQVKVRTQLLFHANCATTSFGNRPVDYKMISKRFTDAWNSWNSQKTTRVWSTRLRITTSIKVKWCPLVKAQLRMLLMVLWRSPALRSAGGATVQLPSDVHECIIGHFVSQPVAGFYDATRLEKRFGRQRSPYIDLGYRSLQCGVADGGEGPATRARLAAMLENNWPRITLRNGIVVPMPSPGHPVYASLADVAVAQYGSIGPGPTPTCLPTSYNMIMSNHLWVGGQNYVGFPEKIEADLMRLFRKRPHGAQFALDAYAQWLTYVLFHGAALRFVVAFRKAMRNGITVYSPTQLGALTRPLTNGQCDHILGVLLSMWHTA